MANDSQETGSEFTILDVWSILKSGWMIILAVVAASLLLAGAYALVAHTYYRVQVVVVPTSDEETAPNGVANRLGSLTSLVGISGPVDQHLMVNIAALKSREFTVQFLTAEGLVQSISPELWDSAAKNWVQNVPNAKERAQQRAFALFDALRSVDVDPASHVCTISLDWKDPVAAAHLLNDLVARLNAELRRRKIAETADRIKYLQAEMARTELTDTRQVFAQLLETQIQSMMIANSRSEYVFRIIDPAVPTLEPFKPQRVTILVLAALSGLLAGCTIVLIGAYLRRLRSAKRT